jgi:hypothetical protein
MYKVEYLVLLDKAKSTCNTANALRNLLQSNSNISINKSKIKHDDYETSFSIKLGKNKDSSHIFFNISVECDQEDDIEKFSILLKAIRSSISLITSNQYVIGDDLSQYYAEKGYPIIFKIENLMRKLIAKFMLTTIGIGWTKERIPTDVQQSKNSNNNDLNYLNNIDFIQLNNFLFSDNYPSHKENLIKELKKAKDFTQLNLDEIKSLLPESNWDKYFEPIVGCEAEYLKKKWSKLYDLRCQIAHNKTFSKNDLAEVKKIVSDLKPHLEKALGSLDKIVMSEEERENVAENVAINLNETYGSFIVKFRNLEKFLFTISNHPKVNSTGKKIKQFGNQTSVLKNEGIINIEQYSELKRIFYFRNSIVHNSESKDVILNEIHRIENMVETYIKFIKDYLVNNFNFTERNN